MKLWILKARTDLTGSNPWEPWYDKTFGAVVRANTEADARRAMADSTFCGDECPRLWGSDARDCSAWLDAKFSTCEELTDDGEGEVVITDFRAA